MTKRKKRILLLFIIAVITLGIITELVPQVTGALTKTEILQYENMQITDEVDCYFVRNETVYMAPKAGAINYYIEDGVKVRKNSNILDIIPQATNAETSQYETMITRLGGDNITLSQMNTAQNGVVSYYIDGYEGYFTPEKMESLQYKNVEGLKLETVNLTRATTLLGEPLFKICQNNFWYVMAWVDPGNISKYEEGKVVKIDLPLGQIKANVEKLVDQGDKWLVTMKTTRYYADFAKLRKVNSNIVTQDYSGIKVRNSSITTKDSVAGVYIKSKNGDFVFTPIKIITSDGDYSLVQVSKFYDKEGKEVNTVDVYDEILKKPNTELKSTSEEDVKVKE